MPLPYPAVFNVDVLAGKRKSKFAQNSTGGIFFGKCIGGNESYGLVA